MKLDTIKQHTFFPNLTTLNLPYCFHTQTTYLIAHTAADHTLYLTCWPYVPKHVIINPYSHIGVMFV